jgi:hypothetical protein
LRIRCFPERSIRRPAFANASLQLLEARPMAEQALFLAQLLRNNCTFLMNKPKNTDSALKK